MNVAADMGPSVWLQLALKEYGAGNSDEEEEEQGEKESEAIRPAGTNAAQALAAAQAALPVIPMV